MRLDMFAQLPRSIANDDHFTEWLKKCADPRLRFRGVKNKSFQLQPKIGRDTSYGDDCGYDFAKEKKLFGEFRRAAHVLLPAGAQMPPPIGS
jgi:hypothetical protein